MQNRMTWTETIRNQHEDLYSYHVILLYTALEGAIP